MKRELTLRIILEKPPAGVDFGLQKGRGSDYETVQTQGSNAKDLSFQFTVGVRDGSQTSLPTLLGPFTQGPPNGRFIYIGTYAGQTNTPWSRRLKISLSGITSSMLERVFADSQAVLETRVPGTGRGGGPTCGTVKPFGG